MKIRFTILLSLSILSLRSYAFEVNGLYPGLTAEQLKEKLPYLKCAPEGDGQLCRATRPGGTYSTVAGHRVASIAAKVDSNRMVQSIGIYLTCGVTTKKVAASFINHYGKAQTVDSLNNRYIWGDQTGDMTLQPTIGSNNICHAAELLPPTAAAAAVPPAETNTSR